MKITEITIINLQHFATQTTELTSPGNNLSPEMKVFYDRNLIELASPKLVHGQFAVKKPITANNGKEIKFRKATPLAKVTTLLTEGVTPEGNKLDFTEFTAHVGQYGDYIETSDMLDLTAIDPIIAETTKLLANQAAISLDTVDREALNAGANVVYCPAGETAVTSRSNLTKDSVLTSDVIMEVVAQLRAANAPTIDGYYVAIVHPHVALDIMKDENWRKPHEYVDTDKVYKGEIGEYQGVRFIQSSEAKIIGKGTDGAPSNLAVYSTIFMGDGAYGTTEVEGGGLEMIIKQLGYGNDPLNQRASVGWKASRVTTILIEDYLVRVESVSSKFSSKAVAN